jgi:hypothetical protein
MTTIQMCRFSNGGFVLHKIPTATGNGRISAWYGPDGRCLDAELFTGLGQMNGRRVKVGGPTWDTLNMWGSIAKHGAGRDSRFTVSG